MNILIVNAFGSTINGKEKLMVIPVGAGAILNIIGNAVLIPIFQNKKII